MALLAHSILPGSIFGTDSSWNRSHACKRKPFLLDIFDPFDSMLSTSSSLYRQPRVPKKYRVTLDCQGYKNESIKTEIKNGKLIISGSDGNKADDAQNEGDYSMKEFRKTYNLPANIDGDKLTRFMTNNGKLVVEIPLKETTKEEEAQVEKANKNVGFPRIVENEKGEKSVSVKLELPKSIDPSKISVTCKDHDLIVKAESVEEKDDSYYKTYFYKRMTLPDETNLEALKCICEDNQLTITAPVHVDEDQEQRKKIRIEYKSDSSSN